MTAGVPVLPGPGLGVPDRGVLPRLLRLAGRSPWLELLCLLASVWPLLIAPLLPHPRELYVMALYEGVAVVAFLVVCLLGMARGVWPGRHRRGAAPRD